MNTPRKSPDIAIAPPSVARMSAPRRSRAGLQQIAIFVEPEIRDRIDEYAAAAGLPRWAIIEAAIRASEPGPDGLPDGWDLPRTTRLDIEATKEADTRAA